MKDGKMKRSSRAWILVLIILFFAADYGAYGQTVIENPEKPLAKNAGRVLKLQEVWRISDDSGKFYFKYPGQLQIAADGSIFLADAEQFLRFSADGKFLKNLYKKGQGPGEIANTFYFFVTGRELVVRDLGKERTWRTEYDGNFLGEFNIRGKRFNGFIGVLNNDLVYIKADWPQPSDRTGKLMELPTTVLLLSKDGTNEKSVFTFHPRTFMAPNAGRSWDVSIELLSEDGKYVVGYHGLKYLIEIVDIDRGKIIRSFSRKYSPVKYVNKRWELDFNKKYGISAMEYESDIMDLKTNGDRIWAQTSTNDQEKGFLWDVFNLDGAFLDNFHIGAGKTLLKAHGDEIYVTEKSTDDAIVLVKYKIVG